MKERNSEKYVIIIIFILFHILCEEYTGKTYNGTPDENGISKQW